MTREETANHLSLLVGLIPGKGWVISLTHLLAGLLNKDILELHRDAFDLDLALETRARPPWDSSERARTVSHFLMFPPPSS